MNVHSSDFCDAVQEIKIVCNSFSISDEIYNRFCLTTRWQVRLFHCMLNRKRYHSLFRINDNIPAAINGPTGTPLKKATPAIVPISNPVMIDGWALIKLTPRPPSHATKIPTTTARIIFQFSSKAPIPSSLIFPDTKGLSTPIVKIIIPIFKPYFSSHGICRSNGVCCITSNTAAEIIIELLWLK